MRMRQSTVRQHLHLLCCHQHGARGFRGSTRGKRQHYNLFCQNPLDQTNQGSAVQCRREQGILLHMDFTGPYCFSICLAECSPLLDLWLTWIPRWLSTCLPRLFVLVLWAWVSFL